MAGTWSLCNMPTWVDARMGSSRIASFRIAFRPSPEKAIPVRSGSGPGPCLTVPPCCAILKSKMECAILKNSILKIEFAIDLEIECTILKSDISQVPRIFFVFNRPPLPRWRAGGPKEQMRSQTSTKRQGLSPSQAQTSQHSFSTIVK